MIEPCASADVQLVKLVRFKNDEIHVIFFTIDGSFTFGFINGVVVGEFGDMSETIKFFILFGVDGFAGEDGFWFIQV